MLSILIPIYNYDVTYLVTELQRQARENDIVYEICLLDDGSSKHFRVINAQLGQNVHIRYQELPQNIGRAAIRNRLAQMAQYDYLLFMDCDSGVVTPKYLAIYLQHIQADLVLYGGRCYLPTPPVNPDYYLHWEYGRQREQQDFQERQRNPYHAFMSNNFLIPSQVYAQIGFEESIRGYGHEDTWFGMKLASKEIPILHLNNPLLHLGLETRSIFLIKTKTAVLNLVKLQQTGHVVDTRLSKTFTKIQAWKLTWIVLLVLMLIRPILVGYLFRAKKPQLFFLDLFKLSLYAEAKRTAMALKL